MTGTDTETGPRPAGAPTSGERFRRIKEYLRALRAANRVRRLEQLERLTGVELRLIRPTGREVLTNPSVVALRGGDLAVAVREVNYRKDRFSAVTFFLDNWQRYHSETWLLSFSTADGRLQRVGGRRLDSPAAFDETGLEDPRIFEWDDELWCLWARAKQLDDGGWASEMILGRIDGDQIVDCVALASPRSRRREKNWMPFVRDRELYVLYDLAHMEIYRFTAGRLEAAHRRETPIPALAGHAGSSQLIPWRDGWLCVSHVTTRNAVVKAIPTSLYVHHFVWLDRDYNLIASSGGFRFGHVGVEFCAGLAQVGDHLILSYGSNDGEARMLKVPVSLVDSRLDPASR